MPHSRQGAPGIQLSSTSPQTLSFTTSPYTYTNTSQSIQTANIAGGAVSLIELLDKSGNAITLGSSVLGLTSGTFTLQPGFSVRITWALTKPTVIIY